MPREQPSIAAPDEDYSSTVEYAEAHKINRAVDQGLITPEQASAADEARLKEVLDTMDKRFIQKSFRPAEFWPRTEGHEAEYLLVNALQRYLDAAGANMTVRHATPHEDQEGDIDIILGLRSEDPFEIPVQYTTSTDPDIIQGKKASLPESVLLVEGGPTARQLRQAIEHGNIRTMAKTLRAVFGDISKQLLRNRLYRERAWKILNLSGSGSH